MSLPAKVRGNGSFCREELAWKVPEEYWLLSNHSYSLGVPFESEELEFPFVWTDTNQGDQRRGTTTEKIIPSD